MSTAASDAVQIPQPRPRSLRSVSPSSDRSSSPLELDPSTLALLNNFYEERQDAEDKFKKLEEAAHARLLKAQSGTKTNASTNDGDDDNDVHEMISVDDFREMFGEDWQLSQFWYSTPFAARLSRFVASQLPPPPDSAARSPSPNPPRAAFLCCPTGFVSFTHLYPNHLRTTRLLEFDRRFGLFGGKSYIPYDIDEPEDVPAELIGTVELAIADPPFLNEVTNRKLVRTLRKILHPTRGRLVLLTSTSVEHLFPSIYDQMPIGPLRKFEGFQVEHQGGIANSFGVWTSWDLSDHEREIAFKGSE